ncbi:MAG: hypothetical protein HLUCCA05_09510 [Roseibaca calidilacus]|uniref:DUF302 domain-containing protein n=1 Tax=Roseibaca calidilacus TaxID=1666912 RepID=A0A0P7WEN5_9RHOB|nr:hypothetical protein [Roseibaca calidilacus]KPP92507.1 MAG: hypothetical protein HLUCCA05_09510 [Roseibaca calidilacus]CUX79804.1 hypothetical protein Ga0058931_0492 [Roseibaca calidilacus]CUX80014.1 hypothetical protein Ga0058931_0713 [Roseibaca calidilacus]
MSYKALGLGLALAMASPAHADGFYTFEAEGSFDDVVFAVEMAITGRGLVIDSVNHIGAMLARTKEDVGGTKDLFAGAQVMSFCSADVSRQVMETDLMNIQHCPYGIYVFQPAEDGAPVMVGYREYSDRSMQPVNYLLQQIVADATN